MEQEIDILAVIAGLRKKIVWLAAAAMIGFGAAYLISEYIIDEKYESTMSIYISNTDTQITIERVMSSDLTTSKAMAASYRHVLASARAQELLREELKKPVYSVDGVDFASDDCKYTYTVSVVDQTEILDIKATSGDYRVPDKVCIAMEAVANYLIKQIFENGKITSLGTPEQCKIDEPASPSVVKNSVIGALAGLIIAVGIVALNVIFDNRVKDAEDFEKKTGLPILGEIPCFDDSKSGKEANGYYGSYENR